MATMPTRRDVCVIVSGEDWNGAPVPRALQWGSMLTLRGAFGEGFDLSGPHVGMCKECGVPLFALHGYGVTRALQEHYGHEHGIDAPLLPR